MSGAMMDFGTIAQWVAVSVSAAALVISLIGGSRKAFRDEIAAVEAKADAGIKAAMAEALACADKLKAADGRLLIVESDMRHMPTIEMFHSMQVMMERQSGQLGIIIESLKPIQATQLRLQEAMLKGHAA